MQEEEIEELRECFSSLKDFLADCVRQNHAVITWLG